MKAGDVSCRLAEKPQKKKQLFQRVVQMYRSSSSTNPFFLGKLCDKNEEWTVEDVGVVYTHAKHSKTRSSARRKKKT